MPAAAAPASEGMTTTTNLKTVHTQQLAFDIPMAPRVIPRDLAPAVAASAVAALSSPVPAECGGVIRFDTPEVFTKELRLQRNAATGERWLRCSSNLLDAFGLGAGTRITRRVLGTHQGLEFVADPAGALKVYERRYTQRRNAPCESQLDVKAQSVIDAAFPGYVERVHFTFRAGQIVAVPVPERAPAIRFGLRQSPTPLTAFVALSAGVDAACLSDAGFRVRSLLEWRPAEKRDLRADGSVRDLSETGILTAISNTKIAHVFNEDLRTVNFERVRALRAGEPQLGCLHVSVQCDDFSAAKAKSLRARHVEDLDTTRDLTYDALRMVEALEPAVVMVENVPGYESAPEGELLAIKLRRWGYHVSAGVFDARDFGGPTSRKRFYLVASVFPGFRFPEPPCPPRVDLWETIVADELSRCRDVTHTSTVQKGIAEGRIRLIEPGATHAPTVMRSQSRGVLKDMVALRTADGRILCPTERILRRLNGLPERFSLDAVGAEIATEQIGQSIDWSLHHAIASAVRDHLMSTWAERVGHRSS